MCCEHCYSTQDTHSPSPGLGLKSSLTTGRRDWDCGPCWVGGTGPGLGLQSLGFRGTGLGLGLQSHPVLRDWDCSLKPYTKTAIPNLGLCVSWAGVEL